MVGDGTFQANISEIPAESSHPQRIYLITFIAIALSIGITVGSMQPHPLVWPWLAAAGLLCCMAVRLRHKATPLAIALLSIAAACLGSGWITLQQRYVAPNNLAAHIGDESTLVRVRGIALTPPAIRARTAGSMAHFDFRKPATYFRLRVQSLLDRNGSPTPMHGELLVRVDETIPSFRTHDRLEATGFLLRPAGPRNPGEFDYREYARSLGQAGVLSVPHRDLLVINHSDRNSLLSMLLHWRDTARQRSSAWLLDDLPDTADSQRNAMLANLLLGVREPQIDDINDAFQRVGLSHVLAISGFHLTVLAGFVLLIARMFSGFRAWHGWLLIVVVLVYLALIEVRMPVLRAGVMTIAASLATVSGRRLRAGGLVSLSAILLLLWRPDQLFNAGFQLTYGVVLGLIYLTPPVRRRWFGNPNPEAPTAFAMFVQWFYSALAVSVVAWLVALPVVVFHFGRITVVGIPMSLVAVPLSALLLAIGYLKMVIAIIFPGVGLILGAPLAVGADLLMWLVRLGDSFSFASISVPFPSTAWTLTSLAWVCWWSLAHKHAPRSHAVIKAATLLALVAWLFIPALAQQLAPEKLRIDMLSVGDGSCYVIRSGNSTVVFDAGSSSDLNVGRRSLVPSMRRLNVTGINAIAVSHADIDHFSAVLELIDEFGVGEVLLTPQFIHEAKSIARGPVAYLIEQLTRRQVTLRVVTAGESHQFGQSQWTWLNPQKNLDYEKTNEGPMVIRIEVGDHRTLLCGDIQKETMENLMRDPASIRADVLELPHHGSYHDVAPKFVEAVHPQIVMQSTGWTRWKNDKWADALKPVDRLVTARDGACWVRLTSSNKLESGRFLSDQGYVPANHNPAEPVQ